MINIEELVNLLPEIILYIVTGYAFLETFHFVALKQNSMDVENMLTSSVVVGYIYCNIAFLVPITVSKTFDNVFIVLSSVLVAYILAGIVRNKGIMSDVLERLKIRETGNTYLWDDLMDNDYPMKVIAAYEDYTYEGMLHIYESDVNEPHIVLAAYTVKDNDGKIIHDYSNDNTMITILNTSNAVNIEIKYHENSPECKDIQNLCDCNNQS